MIVPWNNPEAVIEATERFQLAAILAEPVPANMGVVPPADGFLELLRKRADRTGRATRLRRGDHRISSRAWRGSGAPRGDARSDDLGKVIGGGLPAAAYGGAAVLMEQVAPAGPVYQAGTLAANPLAVAAGLATLELLNAGAYRRLEAVTERLAAGLRRAAADAGVALTVQSVPGLLTPFFSPGPVRDYADAAASDLDAYGAWCRALLALGVYPPASQFEAWFPSLAHTDEDVERTVAAAAVAFERIR